MLAWDLSGQEGAGYPCPGRGAWPLQWGQVGREEREAPAVPELPSSKAWGAPGNAKGVPSSTGRSGLQNFGGPCALREGMVPAKGSTGKGSRSHQLLLSGCTCVRGAAPCTKAPLRLQSWVWNRHIPNGAASCGQLELHCDGDSWPWAASSLAPSPLHHLFPGQALA